MPGKAWIREEEVIVVYFSFYGVSHQAIKEIMRIRGFSRQREGIKKKIRTLKNAGTGTRNGVWDLIQIEHWMKREIGETRSVELTKLDNEVKRAISQVSLTGFSKEACLKVKKHQGNSIVLSIATTIDTRWFWEWVNEDPDDK